MVHFHRLAFVYAALAVFVGLCWQRSHAALVQAVPPKANGVVEKHSLRHYYNVTAAHHRVMWKNFLSHPEHALESTVCTPEDARRIATEWSKSKKDDSNCFSESIFFHLARVDRSKNKLLINVGVNKGYNVATWVAAFFPHSNITGMVWRSLVCKEENFNDAYASTACCGVCFECGQDFHEYRVANASIDGPMKHAYHPPRRPLASSHGVPGVPTTTMIAWDLNKHNLDQIAEAVQKDAFHASLYGNHHRTPRTTPATTTTTTTTTTFAHKSSVLLPRFQLFTVHAAGSNTMGEISIPDCGFGNEMCSIEGTARALPPPQHLGQARVTEETKKSLERFHSTKVTVPVATVDAVLREFARDHVGVDVETTATASSALPPVMVDILMTDTEGNDPLVLQGAREWIRHHHIRMVIFEFHEAKPWSSYALFEVVQEFDSFDYDCFYLGKRYLWRVSRQCWDAVYGVHGWSNLVCVWRQDIWWHVLQPFVRR